MSKRPESIPACCTVSGSQYDHAGMNGPNRTVDDPITEF